MLENIRLSFVRIKVLMLLITIVFVNCTFCFAEDVRIKESEVFTVEVRSMSPLIADGAVYDYFTNDPEEIKLIFHWINSPGVLTDKEIVSNNDGLYFYVYVTYNDGTRSHVVIMPRGIKTDNKNYIFSGDEFKQFCDFLKALKSEKLNVDETFFEVPPDWVVSVVKHVKENDYISTVNRIGYSSKITRLEICQIISGYMKARGVVNGGPVTAFDDTDDEDVLFLKSLGIISGKSSTMFCPYDFITREELAVVLSAVCEKLFIRIHDDMNFIYSEETGYIWAINTITYTDRDDISPWAAKSVCKMNFVGIMSGMGDGTFSPKSYTTKEQIIGILEKIDSELLWHFA